jgi:hypothetical protein
LETEVYLSTLDINGPELSIISSEGRLNGKHMNVTIYY